MEPETTRIYYEEHAAEYFRQTRDRVLPEYWSMLESKVKPGGRILDLGCGSGRDLKHFANGGYRPVGIDYSLPLLKLAARFSGQMTVLGNIRLLPFKAKAFDAAWALASLLHLPHSTVGGTLQQIAYCLKPGAPFFAAVKIGAGEEWDSLGRFNVFYSVDEWAETLSKFGFAVAELRVDVERRPMTNGDCQEFQWIASLATVRSGSRRRLHQPS